MKKQQYVFIGLVVASVATVWTGCSVKSTGSDDPTTTSTGTTTGTTSGTTSTTTTTTTTSGTTTTTTTSTSSSGTACDAPAVAPSKGACVTLSMGGTGGGGGAGGGGTAAKIECNPVTGAPCTTGQACDTVYADGKVAGFQCYDPPNDVKICGACDGGNGPFCENTLHCQGTSCQRYCCDDGDCGTGKCTKVEMNVPLFAATPDMGICL